MKLRIFQNGTAKTEKRQLDFIGAGGIAVTVVDSGDADDPAQITVDGSAVAGSGGDSLTLSFTGNVVG